MAEPQEGTPHAGGQGKTGFAGKVVPRGDATRRGDDSAPVHMIVLDADERRTFETRYRSMPMADLIALYEQRKENTVGDGRDTDINNLIAMEITRKAKAEGQSR